MIRFKIKNIFTLIFALLMCTIGVACDNINNKEEKANINFENEQVETLVENVLNKSKDDLDTDEFQHDFNERLSSFMIKNTLTNDDSVYKLKNGEKLSKDEGMLNLFLIVYRDKENGDITKDDIEKCINNCNKEEESKIASYVKWYDKNSEYVRNIMYAYNDKNTYSEDGKSLCEVNGNRKITELSEEEQISSYGKLKEKVSY